MSKVLIIHPKDSTTQFLDILYSPIENKTVITCNTTKEELWELIETHDQVMMMGHGSPGGLFAVGQFETDRGMVIDETFVDVLSKKDNSIYIWCHADGFVNKHNLKGFFTGMFISEVFEAEYCGFFGTKQDEVDVSNYSFVKMMSKVINKPVKEIHETIKEQYGVVAERSDVAKYNHERLYLNG